MATNNPYDNTKRFGALRSMGYSSGYDTKGREDFDHKVVFTIDYSDAELKLKDARALIGDFGREIKDSMRGVKTSSGTIMADSNFGKYINLEQTVQMPDGKGIAEDMYTLGQYVSSESKDSIKRYIGSRVDTGRMKASIYGRTTKRKGMVVAQAGWLDLWFKYFAYQEEGTKKVRPMHAILRTYLEVAPTVQSLMSNYLRNFSKGEGYKG